MSAPKRILLTGASRGIGLAIAKYLLNEGHKVFLVARTEAPLIELRKAYPEQVDFLAADLRNLQVGPKAISQALDVFKGTLDALILNHGILAPVKRIADSTPEEWRNTYDVNFFSLLSFIQPAIPALRSSKGRIILTSSGASSNTYSTWGAYGSSKAALNHLAGTLATEESEITTIALRPGVVDTEMQVEIRGAHGVMDATDAEKFKSLFEEGKLLRPEQPGNVMARLAVRAAPELSGKFLSWNDQTLAGYQD